WRPEPSSGLTPTRATGSSSRRTAATCSSTSVPSRSRATAAWKRVSRSSSRSRPVPRACRPPTCGPRS
ncbi:MAG: Cold shock protein of CSP family, partial [uncultured Acidimicrobiales bacterium]